MDKNKLLSSAVQALTKAADFCESLRQELIQASAKRDEDLGTQVWVSYTSNGREYYCRGQYKIFQDERGYWNIRIASFGEDFILNQYLSQLTSKSTTLEELVDKVNELVDV